MALQPNDIADLVATAQAELGKGHFTDASTEYQNHPIVSRMFKKERMMPSGRSLEWRVRLKKTGAAKHIGLYNTDSHAVPQVMSTASEQYTILNTSYVIERTEISANSGSAQIVDLVKERRNGAMVDAMELIEEKGLLEPSSSTDTLNPKGLAYWIVYNSTTGFTGQNPSTNSSGAGNIDASLPANANWRNYSAQYTDVSEDDLISKMREARIKTKWNPVVPNSQDFYKGSNHVYFAGTSLYQELEKYLKKQNDNLGTDVHAMANRTVIGGAPVEFTPALDSVSGSPIYQVDFGTFRTAAMPGEWGVEFGPDQAPGRHRVLEWNMDWVYQFICKDRRRNAVFSTAA